MTPTQGRYLSFIRAYKDSFDESPAPSVVAEALEISAASVTQMLKTLEKKQLIRRDAASGTIEILIDAKEIPTWQGGPIERAVRGRVKAEPRRPAKKRGSPASGPIYRLKITLDEIKPSIWRRIETEDVTLEELHAHIQNVMGWTNSHLHQFTLYGKRYTDCHAADGDFDFGAADYSGIRLSDLVAQHGPQLRMTYEYDFGDGWVHSVVLEKIVDADPAQRYPRCTAGARACPPEDVGGIYGYDNFLEAIADPDHEEHEDYMDWIGPFDPEDFDVEEATEAMREGASDW